MSAIPPTTPTTPASQNGSPIVTSTSGKDDQNMFLQLLVSELKNQDPLNPVQGTDFVTQLAQFQQLEQSISSGQDISAIHTDLSQIMTDTTSSTGSTGSQS